MGAEGTGRRICGAVSHPVASANLPRDLEQAYPTGEERRRSFDDQFARARARRGDQRSELAPHMFGTADRLPRVPVLGRFPPSLLNMLFGLRTGGCASGMGELIAWAGSAVVEIRDSFAQ
ncbi:hypothetical protein GCM10022288_25110 [Gryllotalpicola kribbensis]|uniref:Uncharacterized protein n=1 Tax=Gryllotalpicola kribbensis TaxID=993084 RepID=A0ABP8AX55_9MICO